VSAVHIVLPAFNEAPNLPPLLAALRDTLAAGGRPHRIILVDDGSRDGTAAAARAAAGDLRLDIVTHADNRGLGAALASGLARAVDGAAVDDVVVTMDADDTHPPACIPALLACLDAGADLAIASRYQPGARVRGVPWRRRALSRAAAWLIRLAAPVPGVRDATSGFRAYRVAALRSAAALRAPRPLIEGDGFACMLGLLFALDAAGARCAEAPIDLRYDRKRGASKLRVWTTARASMALIARHQRRRPRH